MTGVLIAVAAVAASALLWGLVTGRWSATSRRARKAHASAVRPPLLMRIPVPWVFILTYLAGVGLQLLLPSARVHPSDVPIAVRVAGCVIVGLGVVVAFSALRLFKQKSTTTVPFETPSQLVTFGPYRFSRNPMYVGLTLVYVGVAGTRGDVWPLIVLPLLLAYINYIVIPVEERRLEATFGDSYQRYRAEVRRWV
jgi:protein-S-isoprenylcysteine O-methyltransferase Ste14